MPGAVRRYLAEFLSDRRVVEIPPLLWQPILRGVDPDDAAEEVRARLCPGLDASEGSPLAAITAAPGRAARGQLRAMR